MASPLDRLKDRKLGQWALAYVAGAWVVTQLLDVMASPLGLSGTFQRAVLALLAIGFFLTLILAWYHGEQGRQRVSGPELLILASLLAVGGGVLALLRPTEGGGAPEADPTRSGAAEAETEAGPSIAVLPFADMSPEGDQEYLADGIAEEILNALTRVPGLKVAARTSAFSFKGTDATTRAIGRQLGVGTVLEGSVRMEEDRIRITAQLIDAEDGFHLWSESYDRELQGVFALQDEIARRIVGALREELLSDLSGPLVPEPTNQIEAYTLYLQGRFFWNQRTGDGLRRAIEHFNGAIERDSTFALAYSGLSDAHASLAIYGYAPMEEVLPTMRATAARALELDPGLAEAHTSLAQVNMEGNRWAAAERELALALELNPGYAAAHGLRSQLAAIAGHLDESAESARRAYELDPLSPARAFFYGSILLLAREYDAAEEHLREAAELEPDFGAAYLLLGRLYASTGRNEEALLAVGRGDSLSPPVARGLSASVYARSGERERAERLLTRAIEENSEPMWLAMGYSALGDHEQALQWLERIVDWSWPFPALLRQDPALDPLRSDPRFEDVVDAMEWAWGLSPTLLLEGVP